MRILIDELNEKCSTRFKKKKKEKERKQKNPGLIPRTCVHACMCVCVCACVCSSPGWGVASPQVLPVYKQGWASREKLRKVQLCLRLGRVPFGRRSRASLIF